MENAKNIENPTLIEKTYYTAMTYADTNEGFVSCFHSLESHEDIVELIIDIKTKNPRYPVHPLFAKTRANWYSAFYGNNLARLLSELPGTEHHAEEAKIYWSERIKQTLIPHFLNTENADINDLVFTIVAGEMIDAPFQAETWDPTQQLQFVGIGKNKIFADLRKEIEELSKEIPDGKKLTEAAFEDRSDNLLMNTAYEYAHLSDFRDRLFYLKLGLSWCQT